MPSSSDARPQGSPEWVRAARAYCRDQRELWQQIPALALAAAEPGEDMLELAFGAGYWPVGVSDHLYLAYVDCASGEIVDAEDPSRPASDEAVAQLFSDSRYLNPRQIIPVLKQKIAARQGADPNAEWRAEVGEAMGIDASKPYVRPAGSDGLA